MNIKELIVINIKIKIHIKKIQIKIKRIQLNLLIWIEKWKKKYPKKN